MAKKWVHEVPHARHREHDKQVKLGDGELQSRLQPPNKWTLYNFG